MKLRFKGETGSRFGFAKGDVVEVPDNVTAFPHDFEKIEQGSAKDVKDVKKLASDVKSDAEKLDAAVKANLAKIVANGKGK